MFSEEEIALATLLPPSPSPSGICCYETWPGNFLHARSNYEILVFLRSSFQFVIGSGSNMSDFTYVENVAHANICAEQALSSNAASVAGKVHF